jgi:2'-5' RNA ligase
MSMRCFIAIEVPEDLQEALGRIQAKLRGCGADVKWAAPETIHLTVKFLGDVRSEDVPRACGAMTAAALSARPMELSIRGLGTFPPGGAPRVVWAGLEGDVEPLMKLVAGIEQGIADAVGIAPESRPFHPHLTLGRVRSTRGADRLRAAIEAAGPADVGAFTADELVLYMSELTREGPVHTVMARAKFGR